MQGYIPAFKLNSDVELTFLNAAVVDAHAFQPRVTHYAGLYCEVEKKQAVLSPSLNAFDIEAS